MFWISFGFRFSFMVGYLGVLEMFPGFSTGRNARITIAPVINLRPRPTRRQGAFRDLLSDEFFLYPGFPRFLPPPRKA